MNLVRDPKPAVPPSDAARRVELILARVDAIPTLSPIATRLLALGRSRDADMKEVIRLIENDPALSTRLVGMCRRADKGLGDRITTVKRAVLMLGFEAVRSAALSVAVFEQMRGSDDRSRRELDAELAGAQEAGVLAFDRTGLWKYLVAVGCTAEIIADSHPRLRVQGSEAFLAGLLHGLGKIVLEHILPRAYDSVVRLARRRCSASAAIERQVLGIDHFAAGERIAVHWQLPEAVAHVALLCGVTPTSMPEDANGRLSAIICAAAAICRQFHLGWSGDFDVPPDAARIWRLLGLDSRGPTAIHERMLGSVAERYGILGLDESTPQQILMQCIERANQRLAEAIGVNPGTALPGRPASAGG